MKMGETTQECALADVPAGHGLTARLLTAAVAAVLGEFSGSEGLSGRAARP